MKNLIMFMVVLFSVSDGGAATQSGGRGRVSMTNRIMAAPRATVASKNSLNAMAATNAPATSAALAVTPEQAVPAVKDVDRREKEKNICLSNNIGVGNTFVWASKYSNTQNYVNMVEDVEEPEKPELTADIVLDFVSTFGTYASKWTNSYASHTVTNTDLGVANELTVVFSRASKQTSTITDKPVVAANKSTVYVTVSLANETASGAEFDLQQWTNKTFSSISIEYFSADDLDRVYSLIAKK